MKRASLLLILTLCLFPVSKAADWYASPTGSGTTCSLASPCTLATAITKPAAGDTVYLRAGTYPKVRLIKNGTISQPITYRNYPGERATIDSPSWGNQDSINAPVWLEGSYQIVMGLEIMNSSTTRSGAVPTDGRSAGIQIDGIGDIAINNVIHDCGNGIFASVPSKGAYGNIIYNNGWDAVGGQGATGHGIYFQNNDVNNPKLVQENIFVNSYGYGIHAFTNSNPSAMNGSTLTGNIVANSGAGGGAVRPNVLIGAGSVQARRATVTFNYSWNREVQLYYNNQSNDDLIFTDNVVGKGNIGILYWTTVTMRRNKQYATSSVAVSIDNGDVGKSYDWDANTYFFTHANNQPFSIEGTGFFNFANWKTTTGFDATSTLSTSAPTGTDVFVRPNAYETGRAHIAIFNWDSASSVNVNLSTTGLTNGQSYEIRSAQNFYGTAVLSSTYNSGSPTVSVSMTSAAAIAVATPIGGATPATTTPQFAALIVVPGVGGGGNPAPTVTSIAPTSGTTAGGTAVAITGTGFLAGATVSVGGIAATSVVVVNSTSITAVTPAHAAGAVNVVVTNTDAQSGTLTNGYTYINPAPTVTGISPTAGTTNGGTAITITGTGFLSGATVTLGGTSATSINVVSGTSITAVTPSHAAGAVNVVVTNTDTQTATLTNGYTYVSVGQNQIKGKVTISGPTKVN